jgi:DNA-binding beta-propeller fold protein YncE
MLNPTIEGRISAPDFPPDLDWLNVKKPISIEELRGKVVILGFWTYCCINCLHVLNDLRKLEEKFGSELVVIGIHSAKFTTERNTGNIRQAVMRYEIGHPVVNDYRMEIFNSYNIREWPTIVLVDPEGNIVSQLSGGEVYDVLNDSIVDILEKFEVINEVDHLPIELMLEKEPVLPGFLAFPGKVIADEKTNQLFIADTSHNRVVVLSLKDGTLKYIIGKGVKGSEDGELNNATFNHPQGLAFDGKRLFVADTDNHLIREVDLLQGKVSTLAGTGQKSSFPYKSGHARQVPISSPWDLVLAGKDLYIAMAGTHQIWRLELKTRIISPFAGSGQIARTDGPRNHSALAQPSGITSDGKKLYLADSEVSSIRSVGLEKNGKVETIVGGDLFDYGDTDAKGQEARLQHPLGIAYHKNYLYVADTYNNKIKRVDIREQFCETYAGTGEAGFSDGDSASFNEPGGLSIANGKIYIADTNNHAIRIVDIKTKMVETLNIKGIEMIPGIDTAANPHRRFNGETVQLHAQFVEPGESNLNICLEFPEGYRLKNESPLSLKIMSLAPEVISIEKGSEVVFQNVHFPRDIKVQTREGETVLQLDLAVYYCRDGETSLCMFREVKILLLVNVREGVETRDLKVCYRVPPV